MSEKPTNERAIIDSEKYQNTSTVYFAPSQRKIHDSAVTFEEYHFYAQRTREEQRILQAPKWQWRTVFSKEKESPEHDAPVPGQDGQLANADRIISDEEWTNASRAFRTAGWGAAFYLVCCLR